RRNNFGYNCRAVIRHRNHRLELGNRGRVDVGIGRTRDDAVEDGNTHRGEKAQSQEGGEELTHREISDSHLLQIVPCDRGGRKRGCPASLFLCRIVVVLRYSKNGIQTSIQKQHFSVL